MKKRTINGAIKVQRHYASQGILMYRERKLLIDLPEGTLVTVLKARRQSHLCSVRCVVADAETGQMALGTGRKAVETCIAIPVANLPKMKIEGAAEKPAAKGKGKGKGNRKATALPVVAIEGQPANGQPEVGAGIDQAGLQAENPAAPAPQPAAEAPAPAPQAEAPAPAPEAVVLEPAEQAV
jgi:hypothetical protein